MAPERLWVAVKAAVDAADPEGLLALGGPSDEYSAEIGDLAELVAQGPVTVESVAALWDDWFGDSSIFVGDPGKVSALVATLNELRGLLA